MTRHQHDVDCYWVIREGHVRGEGRYMGDFRSWVATRAGAYHIRHEVDARYQASKAYGECRLVRVTRKPKPADGLAQEDAERCYRNGYLAALAAAEQVCRTAYVEQPMRSATEHLALSLVNLIAALRSK